jgi:NADPH:quinone reductase-like Zn-dependent oxidoreductase
MTAQMQPGAGEVLLGVKAVGINFRDVLNVLGMYPGDPGAPGSDCAGVVMAKGGWRLWLWHRRGFEMAARNPPI